MTHLFAFALCATGFITLALAMRRQQRDVFGRSLRLRTTYALRGAGACALLVALSILVAKQGWSLGLVMLSGHTSLAAGFVYCAFVGYAGMRAGGLRQARPRHAG